MQSGRPLYLIVLMRPNGRRKFCQPEQGASTTLSTARAIIVQRWPRTIVDMNGQGRTNGQGRPGDRA